MEVRSASMQDLAEIARLEAKSYPLREGASKETLQARLAAFPDCFWVLQDKGTILAFINGMACDQPDLKDEMYDQPSLHRAQGRWQMIFSVVTAPECRGRGYAGMLMRRMIQDVKARGHAGVVLTCKEALTGFYAQFGFENEGVSQSSHGGAQWYQMRLRL